MSLKGKTDRQTDKSTRWAFTAYEEQWSLFNDMKQDVAEWGYQTEVCPTTGKPHYQGYIRMSRQYRFKAMKELFPGVHLEVARDWNALLNYCKKTDTAVADTQVHIKNDYEHWSMERLFMEMAKYAYSQDMYDSLRRENGLKLVDDMEYWAIVRSILTVDSSRVAMFATPQVKKIWANTRSVWIAKQARGDSITAPCPQGTPGTVPDPPESATLRIVLKD